MVKLHKPELHIFLGGVDVLFIFESMYQYQ